jgi:hypothetical protein
MKRLYTLALTLSCLSCSAYTVKSDFLRVAKTFKDAQFPLDIEGYLDLTFRVSLKDSSAQNIVRALVERRIDGKTESSYLGDFEYGKKVAVLFADGTVGPLLMFVGSEPQKPVEPQESDDEARAFVGKAVVARSKS